MKNTRWTPIETAPKDRPVLTDAGIVMWVDEYTARSWGVSPGWFLCDSCENLFTCADDGIHPFSASPKYWTEFP